MKKTLLINCSPKKRLSVSGFIMRCAGLMIRGEKVYLPLRTPADRERVLREAADAGQAVFSMPLYVDGVPSHVLPFLKEMETFCRDRGLGLKVYVIANNGFIEGRQNEPLMRVMENFCARAGLDFCGGIGIGGGVMLNVERIMIPIVFGLTVLNMLAGAFQGRGVTEPLLSFTRSLAQVLILTCGIIGFTARLARHVNHGTDAGKRYTRILLPSFVFILAADLFFTIVSVLQGGIFRGWLARPRPRASTLPAAGEQ